MRAALKGILKKAGRKAHSANFKHMHIADSRHKGRRIAIMSSNGHEKTKEMSKFKQVDVLPSKNQALCDLIFNILYIIISI